MAKFRGLMFDVQRRIQPCDWLGKSHFCV